MQTPCEPVGLHVVWPCSLPPVLLSYPPSPHSCLLFAFLLRRTHRTTARTLLQQEAALPFLLRIAFFHVEPRHLLPINQMSIQIPPLHKGLPELPLLEGTRSGTFPLISIPILCLIFLYCFAHDLKLYY